MAFNTRIAAVAVAAAVAGGGAAFLLSPTISAAQEDQQETPSDSTETPPLPDGSGGELPEGAMPGGPQGSESGAACGPMGERPGGHMLGLDAAAEAIGIDVEELSTALRDGQTIAEVAEENGVDSDEVVSAMVAAAEERLAQAVEEGQLTEDEADEIAAELPERIAEMVQNGPPEGGPQGGMPGGPPGGEDQGSDSEGAETSARRV
jgi:hypothetical protein